MRGGQAETEPVRLASGWGWGSERTLRVEQTLRPRTRTRRSTRSRSKSAFVTVCRQVPTRKPKDVFACEQTRRPGLTDVMFESPVREAVVHCHARAAETFFATRPASEIGNFGASRT